MSENAFPREDFNDNLECFDDKWHRPGIVAEKAAVAFEQGNFDYYFASIPCEQRLSTLLERSDRFSDRDFWHYVRRFWNKDCLVSKGSGWDPLPFIRIMTGERPNRQFLMKEHERKILQELPDEFFVYRGCSSENVHRSWSWTLSEEIARKFATKYKGDSVGVVLRGRCFRERVIAFFEFESLNEKEILVNPDDVSSLERRDVTSIRVKRREPPWEPYIG